MNVVFIGAGNVATHLASIIQNAGHSVIQVFSKTKESSNVLAANLRCDSTTDFLIQENCKQIILEFLIYILYNEKGDENAD